MPGMLSLNLWSGLPAPSGLTQEPWWAILLSPAQLASSLQQRALQTACVLVRNHAFVHFRLRYSSSQQLPQIPMVRFLEDDFVAIPRDGHYTISVRNASRRLAKAIAVDWNRAGA